MKKTTINLLNSIGRFFKSFGKWIFDHKIWSAIILLIILGGAYFQFAPKKASQGSEEIVVTRKNLEEAVSLTGRVKPTEEATITFEKSGTIRNVNVKTGDRVFKGQTLATLSADDVYARVAEAQANLNAQIAILDDLNSGAKEEQIALKKIAIEKSENDLNQAYSGVQDTIRNITITGNDIVRVNFSKLFSGNLSTGYTINTNTCEAQKESLLNLKRSEAENSIIKIENSYTKYSTLQTDIERKAEIENIRREMAVISGFLNDMQTLFSANCVTSVASYDATRSVITSSRSGWSSLLLDLNTKVNTINSLNIALSSAKSDLKLLESNEKTEKVRQQEASIAASRARLSQASSEAAKNVLRAPFNGIITAVDLKNGEYATIGGAKSISLISDAEFEIESKVSEVDVAKIKKGDVAKVTFDAYGENEIFEAAITNISPYVVITDGVPTYKTIFSFTKKDEKIRSGMTANIDVVTKIHENVLTLPARAVKNVSGERKVTILINKEKNDTEEKTVKTGVRGSMGEIEILEGVTEGDLILIDTQK